MVSVLDYLGKLHVRQDVLRTYYVATHRCSAVNASRSPMTPPRLCHHGDVQVPSCHHGDGTPFSSRKWRYGGS
uniref:Uncharacterized protein n=1 Tax=Oryza glumipatula TaxID=40148 RepID=A0A0D9Y3D1_9ORYZ